MRMKLARFERYSRGEEIPEAERERLRRVYPYAVEEDGDGNDGTAMRARRPGAIHGIGQERQGTADGGETATDDDNGDGNGGTADADDEPAERQGRIYYRDARGRFCRA